MGEKFDYESTLRQLIEERFEATLRGQVSTPEIRQLEREIYAHVRSRPAPPSIADVDPAAGSTDQH